MLRLIKTLIFFKNYLIRKSSNLSKKEIKNNFYFCPLEHILKSNVCPFSTNSEFTQILTQKWISNVQFVISIAHFSHPHFCKLKSMLLKASVRFLLSTLKVCLPLECNLFGLGIRKYWNYLGISFFGGLGAGIFLMQSFLE